METFKRVGLTIRVLRELRGIRQSQLARAAGLGKSQVSKYENGKELPKLDSLARVLEVLDVRPLDFFYTLQVIEERAEALAGGKAPLPIVSFLPEVSALFTKLIEDVLQLHREVLNQALHSHDLMEKKSGEERR